MNTGPGFHRLLATCGAVSVALLPHVLHLPAWITAGFALTVTWRLVAEQRAYAMPARGWVLSGAALAVVGVLFSYHTLNGLDAGTALLSLMAALKLLETRAPRDHAVLVFVGYLLCLATLLYDESAARLAFVLVAVWLLTAALARVHRPPDANSAVRPLALSGRTLALSLPVAVVLFLFVPRLEGHFWALPSREQVAHTGIGDAMTPGDIAHLAGSDEPAFRVWFHDPAPPLELRYWRVQVLENFDGRTWRRTWTRADAAPPPLTDNDASIAYRVAMEPARRPWLATLDSVVEWPNDVARRSRALQLTLLGAGGRDAEGIPTRFEIELRSSTTARSMAGALPEDLYQRDLALPDGRAPRARALAASMRAAASDELAYIAAVLRRFHEQDYGYTLEPPPLGAEPTDEFLFGTRLGFCEHYAAAFTVLMRAAGIPARVVIGYQGGEWNRYGGYLLVQQSRAHAWSEVWLAGRGWVRVDPTAAVAPERIRRDDANLAASGGGLPQVIVDWAWVGRARQLADAARTAWYRGIVNFDAATQQHVLERIGLGDLGLQGLAIALAAGFLLAALALAAWLAWELRAPPADAVTRAWLSACAGLAAAGLARAAAEAPLDYARRVAARAPSLAGAVAELADAYVRARYLPGATRADVERLQTLAQTVRARARENRT